MAPLATVADVADIAGTVPAADITRVENLIDKVSAVVRRYTGQLFDLVADDIVRVRPYDGIVRLPQRPVVTVSEVSAQTVPLDAGTYEWTENGYLRPIVPSTAAWWSEASFDGNWRWPAAWLDVTYTHGYADVPADLALVVAEKAGRLYRFGTDNAVTAENIDGYSATYDRAGGAGPWSPEHKAVLDSYRRSGAASLRLS